MSARWFHRSCPICEASCGLRVLADRERREVLRIEGNAEDPISRGHLCPKATALAGVFEDPDRIRRPIRRMPDGDWAELDWDEALDFAAEGLRRIQTEHGPEALGLYIGNPSGFDVGSLLYNRYLFEALRTPRMSSAATMDHFPKLYTSRVLFGKGSILPIPGIDRCDYFLCLGGNPIVSQGSLMGAPDVRKRLRAVQERGGRIVVVDPRRTETARVADEHLFIRPGADAYLLFSLVHVIFEEGLLRPGRLGEHVDGLDEIRALIELRESPAEDCGDINALLDEHIGHVTQRIRELRVLEKELKVLRARCSAPHPVAECGIVGELDRAAGQPAAPVRKPRHVSGTH